MPQSTLPFPGGSVRSLDLVGAAAAVDRLPGERRDCDADRDDPEDQCELDGEADDGADDAADPPAEDDAHDGEGEDDEAVERRGLTTFDDLGSEPEAEDDAGDGAEDVKHAGVFLP